MTPRVPGNDAHTFSLEQVKLVVESSGLSLDEPLREQLDPTPDEPQTPEAALAARLVAAQSTWFSTGGGQ